jgi:hypothetical protein
MIKIGHNVYVVELDRKVLAHKKVRNLNPLAKPYLPPLYVGETGLSPEERFAKHKAGLKANIWVNKYGLHLRPELYKDFNPMPFHKAEKTEEWLARKLRRKGYPVVGGNKQTRVLKKSGEEDEKDTIKGYIKAIPTAILNQLSFEDIKDTWDKYKVKLFRHGLQAHHLTLGDLPAPKNISHNLLNKIVGNTSHFILNKKADWSAYDRKRKNDELPEQQARVVRRIQDPKTPGLVLFHGMGSGKAEVVNNKLFTPTGTIEIGKLKIGDKVIGQNGLPTKVTGVFPQGLKDVYKVSFRDEVSMECCGEHLWLTTTHKERRNYNRSNAKYKDKWMGGARSTLEIKDTLTDGSSLNYVIPTVLPVQFDYKQVPIDPYLLGLLLGDGGLTRRSISFTSADQDIIDNIQLLLLNEEYIIKKNNSNSNYDYTFKKKTGYRNPLITALRKLDLYKKGSINKFIPELYKFNSIESRLAVLQGLMDTDGTVGKSGISVSFTSISEQLAKDVLFLVQSFGGTGVIRSRVTKYTYKGVKKEGKRSYTVHMSLPPEIKPFRLLRKSNRVKPRTKYKPTRYISNVEYVGKKECVCIAVENPNHLYVTENFIVTHNTRASLEAYKALKMNTDVIVPAALQENYRKESRKWLGKVPKNMNIVSQQRLANPNLKTKLYGNGLQIIDEAQKARNDRGELHRALAKTNPEKRLLLSGTPMVNDPAELGTLVNLAARKNLLPTSRADFKKQYFKPEEVNPGFLGRMTGVKPGIAYKLQHKKELGKILDKYVDYYKPSQEGYPTVREEDVYNSILGQASWWTQYKVKHNIPPGRGELEGMKAFLSGPRQVSNTTSGFTKNLRDVEDPKINTAFKFLQKQIQHDPSYKALIYSNYLNNGIKPYEQLLKKNNIPYGEFSGDVTNSQRNKTILDYNANKLRALLVSGAGAEGLDLKATRLEQLLDPHWNLSKERQVIGRGARFHSHDELPPSKRNVLVQRYFAEPRASWFDKFTFNPRPTGTDEYIHNLAKQKDQMNQEVVNLIAKEDKPNWLPWVD